VVSNDFQHPKKLVSFLENQRFSGRKKSKGFFSVLDAGN